MQKETLTGGRFEGRVIRIGDTVHRPVHEATVAIHAFLVHLDTVGFPGSPRVLGFDADGREVVTFIAGDVPTTPLPDWARSDTALISVACLLKQFHQAAATFIPPDNAVWQRGTPPNVGPVVCHNDVCPTNIVFRDGEAVALIDFDWAHPSDPLWDVAMAAWHWVPLLAPVDRLAGDLDRDVMARLRLFCDVYALTAQERVHIPGIAELFNRRKHAALGLEPHDPWARQMADRCLRSAQWLQQQQDVLRMRLR